MFDCLVITGPTAVGKTASLLALQDQLSRPLEVISADAFQVYQGLDIGTAKPNAQLLARIPHHLLDIHSISEQYSVADFVKAAQWLIADIRNRGSIPVICGGAVYYIKHLIWGLPETPASDAIVRKTIASEHLQVGSAGLYRRLLAVDPVSAQSIDPADVYRISRALEVWQISGRPLSSYARVNSKPACQALLVGLQRNRSQLVQIIGDRVDGMLAAGLSDEVTRLVTKGFKATDPGMQAIGYKEFMDAGINPGLVFPEKALIAISDIIKIHTRQYAKRQMTFLRSLNNIHWLEVGDPQQLADQIIALASENAPGLLT